MASCSRKVSSSDTMAVLIASSSRGVLLVAFSYGRGRSAINPHHRVCCDLKSCDSYPSGDEFNGVTCLTARPHLDNELGRSENPVLEVRLTDRCCRTASWARAIDTLTFSISGCESSRASHKERLVPAFF